MAVIDVYENQAKLGTPASQTSGVHPDMGGQMGAGKGKCKSYQYDGRGRAEAL